MLSSLPLNQNNKKCPKDYLTIWEKIGNTVSFYNSHLKLQDFFDKYSFVKITPWRFSIPNTIILSWYINTSLTQGHSVRLFRKQQNPCTSSSRIFSTALHNLLLSNLYLTFFPNAGQICHLIPAFSPISDSLLGWLYPYRCNQHLLQID